MRKFKLYDNSSVQDKNISNLIESHFGSVSESNENKFIVDEPKHSTLEEVCIQINYDSKELLLDIQEKDLSEIQSNGLLSTVPEVVQSKNKFLKTVTGTTVEDRKKEWRKDVLPTDETEIRMT